jgi:hypothetical protein
MDRDDYADHWLRRARLVHRRGGAMLDYASAMLARARRTHLDAQKRPAFDWMAFLAEEEPETEP